MPGEWGVAVAILLVASQVYWPALPGGLLWFYLGNLLWPDALIFIYPRWVIEPGAVSWWVPLAGAVALHFLPGSPSAHDNLAQALRLAGRAGEANAAVERAARLRAASRGELSR